jgi:PIN domain nuclease of toxin-antitoxin system
VKYLLDINVLIWGVAIPDKVNKTSSLLIAQARSETMVILTADSAFRKYQVETIFCGM